jgi:hypothetical protein
LSNVLGSGPDTFDGKFSGSNSAAIRLFGRLIPLIGRQIPLLRSVGNFTQTLNRNNHLQARVRPAKGPSSRVSLFFPVEQGIRRRGPVMLR